MSIWAPHPGPQSEFCSRWEFEALYGGQAGPGKTDCLIMEAVRYVDNPRYKGLILRRNFPQLQEIIDRTRNYYNQMGAEYKAGEHRWYWPSGASVTLGHIQHEGDEYSYQGKEFQYVGFDEATQFQPKQYLYLFSRTRTTDPSIPPRVRAATNPGGIGHQFIKDRFRIGHVPPGVTIRDDDTGLTRVFIAGKLTDNPTLLLNDPMYVNRLMALPEIERIRLMEGVWDAFEGQAFRELNTDLHAIDPFDIPPEWPRYRSFDWGYAAPFSVGWWAVDYSGCVYRYREWYGGKVDPSTGKWVGLRMTPVEIARGIIERERGEKVVVGPADPSIWQQRPNKHGVMGPSTAEEMSKEGIHWIRADNDRIHGWQQFHKRLELNDDDEPQVRIFRDCDNWWRTIPLMREYEKNPEDLETKGVEDHIADETRYFFMFRPLTPRHKPREDYNSFQAERKRLIQARALVSRHGMSIREAYERVR